MTRRSSDAWNVTLTRTSHYEGMATSPKTLDLATATPVQIDTELAKVMKQQVQADNTHLYAIISIHHNAGDRKRYLGNKTFWTMKDAEATSRVQEISATDTTYVGKQAAQSLAALNKALDAVGYLDKQAQVFNDEFERRGGWTRAFLATSTKGHIHSSTACSTCRPSTTFYFFTDLSGHAESEIVTKAGSDACTVCFPSAPVNDLLRPRSIFSDDEVAAREAKVARESAKAERATNKLKKALLPTGEPLRFTDGYGFRESLGTLAAAKMYLTREYARPTQHDSTQVVVQAVAAKEGVTTDQVVDQARKRAAKSR